MKTDPLAPSAALLIKLGSVIVHQEELMSPHGHEFDKYALEAVRNDPDVVAWLNAMTKQGFLPVKRN